MKGVRSVWMWAGLVAAVQGAAAQRWEIESPPPEWAASDDVRVTAQADARSDVRVFANPAGRTMAFIADEMGHERVVKGAPYCADALHESIQPLADGNRIVRKQVTRLCRDGDGRTRQEVDLDGHKRVYLRDPVAQETWLLDPERKTARRLLAGGGRFEGPADADGAAWRDYADRMREWARVFGERTTWTIEPGRLGNEKAIVITREVWTSPELLLTVQSRDADPRSGETHYRLINVKRGEPEAVLMKPPPDYEQRRGGSPRPPTPPVGASGRG